LTGGAGPGGHLSGKRGTEDLDFFIGDEALAAAGGPGYGLHYPIRHGQIENWVSGRITYENVDLIDNRTTWNASGRTQYSNTSGLSRRTIIFFSLNL
jgi:hypothetical protein